MKQALTTLCENALPIVTDCANRVKPQAYTCRDPKTRSEVTVNWSKSVQGIAFATDHAMPQGSALSCDWCVCHCNRQKTECFGMLVELKGRDFAHAVRQLASTHAALRMQWPKLRITRCLAILSGRHIPSVVSRDYQIVAKYCLPHFERYRARKGLTVDV